MKKLLFFLFLVTAATALDAQPTLKGNWLNGKSVNYLELTFDGNGNGYQNGAPFKYWVREGKYFEEIGDTVYTYNYVLDGNTLTLTEGGIEGDLKFIRGQMGYWGPAGTKDARLLGLWVNEADTFSFQADGSGQLKGEKFQYQAGGQLLHLEYSGWGTKDYAYAVIQDTLLLSADNQIYRLQRQPGSGVPEIDLPLSPPADAQGIVGEWTSYGEETIEEAFEQGDEFLSRYLYLDELGNADLIFLEFGSYPGTYKYDGEQFHINIRSIGRITYKIEKRNHPETGAPLILLDGKAFVGRFGHAPW